MTCILSDPLSFLTALWGEIIHIQQKLDILLSFDCIKVILKYFFFKQTKKKLVPR